MELLGSDRTKLKFFKTFSYIGWIKSKDLLEKFHFKFRFNQRNSRTIPINPLAVLRCCTNDFSGSSRVYFLTEAV